MPPHEKYYLTSAGFPAWRAHRESPPEIQGAEPFQMEKKQEGNSRCCGEDKGKTGVYDIGSLHGGYLP